MANKAAIAPRSCVETCQSIIGIAPDGPFSREMLRFVQGVFCEMPENSPTYWGSAAAIMFKYIPVKGGESWQIEARRIWFGEEASCASKSEEQPV